MSGGSFDYAYSRVDSFAEELGLKLDRNEVEDEYGWKVGFSAETVAKLREIEALARRTAALMKEAEWLYSGDTGEDSFAERVRHIETANGEVRGASVTAQPACEASSAEGATSTVVLEGGATGGND